MLDAQTMMKQAAMTAEDWMLSAGDFVGRLYPGCSDQVRATLIAAYVNAAAKDEIAMYLRAIAEEAGWLQAIADEIGSRGADAV